ncbi:hypothetical protein ACB092_06G091400 [Castanea dentata]
MGCEVELQQTLFTSLKAESKRQTLSPGKDGVIDRISNLLEPLLCHILSFLPTKDSIATSILSTRLDLDSDTIDTSELSADDDDDEEDERDIMFAHIVSSVLAQQEFEELDLDIFTDREENLKLPPSFLSCRTLVVLKLSGTIDIVINIDTPSLSFNFPSLKILHLEEISSPSIINSQENSFLRPLSGCPVLEDLSFTSDHFEGECKICVPTLKRLSISETEYNESDYELKINAPALEYFDFEGDLRDIKFHEKLDNLVQANWHNVGNVFLSSFQNLVQLDFNVTDCNWPVLQDLLQNAPNLETLVTKYISHILLWHNSTQYTSIRVRYSKMHFLLKKILIE